MSKKDSNGDEVPAAEKAKLNKILDRAQREQAEEEAYLQAAAGAEGGEPKTVRDTYDKKMGYKK